MDNDYLTSAFRRPMNYQFTPDIELSTNTQQPEFNSREFMYKVYTEDRNTKEFEPVFSLIDSYQQLFVLGTNNFTSGITGGNFFGAENFEAFVDHDLSKTHFQLPFKSTVTGLKFIGSHIVSQMLRENTKY